MEINNNMFVGSGRVGVFSFPTDDYQGQKFSFRTTLIGCDVKALFTYLGYEQKDCGCNGSCFYSSVAYQAIRMGLKEGEFDPQNWQEYCEDIKSAFPLLSEQEKRQIRGGHYKTYEQEEYIENITSMPWEAGIADIDGRLVAAKYGRPVLVFDGRREIVTRVFRDRVELFLDFGELYEFMINEDPILIYDAGGHFQALVLKEKNK